MPKRPSFASSWITSRGRIPCSNQSPTSGTICSRTNCRTVSRIAFSSSSSSASIARKSSGSSATGCSVVGADTCTSGVGTDDDGRNTIKNRERLSDRPRGRGPAPVRGARRVTRIPRHSLSGSVGERLGDRAGDDLPTVAQEQRMRRRGGQLLEVVRRHHDRELGLVARRGGRARRAASRGPGGRAPRPARRAGAAAAGRRAPARSARACARPASSRRTGARRAARARTCRAGRRPGRDRAPTGAPRSSRSSPSPRCGSPGARSGAARSGRPTRASTKPIDSRSRATSVRPIVSPRISTVPRLANSTAPASVSSVVLPAPFGPRRAQRSPRPTSQSIPSRSALRRAARGVPAPDLDAARGGARRA